MRQGTGILVRDREKFEIEKFEIEKGRRCFSLKTQGTEHFVRDGEIFEIEEGSRDRESPLYFK